MQCLLHTWQTLDTWECEDHLVGWEDKLQTEREAVEAQQVLTPARALPLTWKLGTGIRTSPQLGNICPAQFLTLIQGVR